MKKTVCIYNVGVGNTELLATKIAYWQKRGIKVKIVCPTAIVPQFKKLTKDITFITIPFCRIAKNKFILIGELLKRSLITVFFIPPIIKKTDVIYSISSVLDALLIPFLIKFFNRRIIWVAVFDNEVSMRRSGNFLIRLLAYLFYQLSCLLLRKADKIFVISEELKSALIKKGIKKERIVLTGNAVDAVKIKKAISIKEHWCDGLFLGRIDEAKGVFDLVKICQSVTKKYSDFTLWIAGSGDQSTEHKLVEKIKRAKLSKNIKLLGYVAGFKKFRLLANTNLFLFPSRRESFGVALLEAVCSGVKAVAYDLPAYKDIYRHNELITVSLGDISGFSKAVINLLDKKDFKNTNGLRLLNSPKYRYSRISQLELNSFIKR